MGEDFALSTNQTSAAVTAGGTATFNLGYASGRIQSDCESDLHASHDVNALDLLSKSRLRHPAGREHSGFDSHSDDYDHGDDNRRAAIEREAIWHIRRS